MNKDEQIKDLATWIAQTSAQKEPVPDDPKLAYYRGIIDALTLLMERSDGKVANV